MGQRYLDPRGRVVSSPQVLQRIKALAIPPAWRDVWICPNPLGHVQATGRKAGFVEEPRDRHERARRILGSLDDDGATGAEGRDDLADRLVVREIPRREGGDDADRFFQHELPHALRARGNHAAAHDCRIG